MWYLILGRDAPGSLEHRLRERPAHLARLKALVDQGRLLVAGPLPTIDAEDPGPAGFAGSAIIAEFDSLETARAWADADPYLAAGVYTGVEVMPFRRVLP
ncbi:YciI family protein [Pseudomarimonas salicorniae]|uniref:YciI family protein n=1 Tax=Pseudomarimonas salicorniae TaxID=2933270 RepID=A0ABT0GL12_9GAMM|nr:YciI family protein [Lysobacter sp. CAU 1642]MCK7595210.1 YciI family protein [Lysobacter sp. CAU 1642]